MTRLIGSRVLMTQWSQSQLVRPGRGRSWRYDANAKVNLRNTLLMIRNSAAALAGILVLVSGLASWILLDAATPSPPAIVQPGVVGLAPLGPPGLRKPVEAALRVAVSDQRVTDF